MESKAHKMLKEAVAEAIGGKIECTIKNGRADACNSLINAEVDCLKTKEERKCNIRFYEKGCKKKKRKYSCDPLYAISSEEISGNLDKCENGLKSKDELFSCVVNGIKREKEEKDPLDRLIKRLRSLRI